MTIVFKNNSTTTSLYNVGYKTNFIYVTESIYSCMHFHIALAMEDAFMRTQLT